MDLTVIGPCALPAPGGFKSGCAWLTWSIICCILVHHSPRNAVTSELVVAAALLINARICSSSDLGLEEPTVAISATATATAARTAMMPLTIHTIRFRRRTPGGGARHPAGLGIQSGAAEGAGGHAEGCCQSGWGGYAPCGG